MEIPSSSSNDPSQTPNPSSTNEASSPSGQVDASNSNSGGVDSNFECNICLDTARDAVVSMCGHLFCWPCLHQWFKTKSQQTTCPVCKNPINKEQVIPLYGRGSSRKDPRNTTIPPRPPGQRTEAEFPQNFFPNFGFGDGFHMSFGIGAFPFGFFASTFNFGEFRAVPTAMNQVEMEQDQFVSKIFLWMAIIFIVWLLFA